MNLKSPKIIIKKSAEQLYEFLENFENFKRLMPDDINKFESNSDTFSFALKGMPEIKLRLKEKKPSQKIVLTSANEKLSFSLSADITAVSESSCEAQFVFDGTFNPMMAMMVKKPLNGFITTLAGNMKKL